MDETILLQRFLAALALGALIGLEREYARFKKKGHDYAGIRTFPLISMFGALCAYLGATISPWLLYIGMLLTGGLIIIAYLIISRKQPAYHGATSEMAGFLTFFLGVLAFHGQLKFAAFLAIAITIILYARSMLHKFAQKIKAKEMEDTLKFAVVAFIILPFLPNQGYGPLEMFNPFIIWLMVVFISGISFVGYIMMKMVGEKGVVLAGVLGGLVSSTAVTTSFAARSAKQLKFHKALALGVILANGIMFIRILIEVFVINRLLFWQVLLPMVLLAVVTALFCFFLYKKSKDTKGDVHLSSPFTLGPALKFGVFFAFILALVKIANLYFQTSGVYLVSFISGFADVDAITISLSQLAKTSLDLITARNAIVIAALTNVAVKGGIAYWFGGKEFGRLVLSFFLILLILGVGFIFLF